MSVFGRPKNFLCDQLVATRAFADTEGPDPQPDIFSTGGFAHPAVAEEQSQIVPINPDIISPLDEEGDREVTNSLDNQSGRGIDLSIYIGDNTFQVEVEKLRDIRDVPLVNSGKEFDVVGVTPERRNISRDLNFRNIIVGLDPWNNFGNDILWSSLDDTNMLLSYGVPVNGSAYELNNSSSMSSNILTPSFGSSSPNARQQPSTDPQESMEILNLQRQASAKTDIEDSRSALTVQSSNAEAKPKCRKRRYNPDELEKVNSVRASSACIRCQVMKEAVCH